ncbi:MAG: PAAR domain-containing protein [Bryobacteraceae bacterium]
MPEGPAARIMDPVSHPLPPVLQPGPGSSNVLIGMKPAWRGIPAAAAAGLQAAKQAADIAVQAAETATKAAAGTPGAPVAYAAEQAVKAGVLSALGSAISAMGGMSDIHICTVPSPVPPHGPGVVIDGSKTVQINFMPACRQGDSLLEPLGPPNKISMGCPTVKIGG